MRNFFPPRSPGLNERRAVNLTCTREEGPRVQEIAYIFMYIFFLAHKIRSLSGRKAAEKVFRAQGEGPLLRGRPRAAEIF